MGRSRSGQVMFRIPIIAAKKCPICFISRAFDPRESNAPIGWVHIVYRGVDNYVCSETCQNEVIRRQDAWIERLEKSREDPPLPPDVIIQ